jgi:exopolysaccharide biosynthesis polyprenyl glycosylphosphotransferase
MLKAHAKATRLLAYATDAVVVSLALTIAWFYQDFSGAAGDNISFLLLAVFLVPVWLLLLNHYALCGSLRRRSRTDLAISVVMVHLVGGIIVGATLFLVAPELFPTKILLVFLVASFVLLTTEKVLVRSSLGFFRRRGFNTRNLLIAGCPQDVQRFDERLAGHSDWGLIVLGVVLTERDAGHRVPETLKVLGEFAEIVSVCKSHPVDEVILCTPRDLVPDLKEKFFDLQELGVSVRVILESFDQRYSKKELGYFCDRIPFLTISSNRLDTETVFLKRALDIVGSLTGLALTAAIFPFIAFAIKHESSGPVFFGQERVGENGRIFTVWKFRSMHTDAEERKQELLARNEMQGAIFKIANDPRVTCVGQFLRRTSLDEFPQFWNVLIGDMSLVGTRPPTPDEVERYENWQRRRISIRPGITGIWQTSGRNHLKKFDDIVRLDLNYIDNWTLWLDLKILLKTVRVVLTREGSC